uniref:Uncharacterized protein n=1 Tax=Schistocephalus solidus TaxID=70667 RepID=A0A0X3Q756_SCHSO
MATQGLMSLAIWFINAAFASAQMDIIIQTHKLKKDSDFEFATFVPNFSDVTAEWTHARGTSENPCVAPQPCVQFYPIKTSFRIFGKPDSLPAALIITPQKPNLPTIALMLMQDTEWFPVVPGVQIHRFIQFNDDVSESWIFEFDEDIKDIMVWGAIATFSVDAPRNYMKLEVPYDNHKLMRVTGRMENKYLAVTVGNYDLGERTFTFIPSERAGILRNPSHFLKWPKRFVG